MVYNHTRFCTSGQTRSIQAQRRFTFSSSFFPGSQDAGKYTRNELNNFWDSILISAASQKALKMFSQRLIVF